MRVVIVGAGAIGTYLGTCLASNGHQVGALARGATQEALIKQGWRSLKDGHLLQAPCHGASQNAIELLSRFAGSPPDLIILALKSFSVPALAPALSQLIGPNTTVLSAMNGVPWWFFQDFGGPAKNMPLPSVDPAGVIAQAVPASAVLGCVVHMTCSSPEPGLSKHGFGDRLILGEPNGNESERIRFVSDQLSQAGFQAPIVADIHREIWYKLWGNLTTNPISALTLATTDRLLDDELISAYCLAIMAEAASIGAKIGCPIAQSGEDRIALTRHLGAFKTSMLQDREAQRPLEFEALVSAVHQIGRHLGIATPMIDSLLGLVRVLDRSLQKA